MKRIAAAVAALLLLPGCSSPASKDARIGEAVELDDLTITVEDKGVRTAEQGADPAEWDGKEVRAYEVFIENTSDKSVDLSGVSKGAASTDAGSPVDVFDPGYYSEALGTVPAGHKASAKFTYGIPDGATEITVVIAGVGDDIPFTGNL
ncbi:hypothetical protein ACU4IU_00070 [Brevibacterium sp. CSND-B09]|uniref:hypothetical protein n=1 Tax=Brevibacterium sp. CSND-B09 TaxID=3462571 RepID=UPI00406A0A44